MANKDVQESIAKLVRERPRALLDSMMALGLEPDPKLVTAGLRFLVEDFRRQAELVMDSGARGKGAEATALRSTASSLSLLADAVEKVDLDEVAAPAPSRGGPKLPAEWCGDQDEHGTHIWQKPGGGLAQDARRECTGHHARDLSGLDALVGERAAKQAQLDAFGVPDFRGPGDLADPNVGSVRVVEIPPGDGMQTVTLDPPVTGPGTIVATFAAPARQHGGGLPMTTTVGAPDDVPVSVNGTHERVPVPDYLLKPNPELEAYLKGDDTAPVEPTRVNTPELRQEAAAMFAAPTPPSKPVEPVMPGRRLTFAELLAPPPVAPPEHMSKSQIDAMSCGTQYRLTRLEPGVVERPRWANVGGTALHSAVEWFEKQVAKAPADAGYARARIEIAGGIEKIWTDHFGQAVTEQSLACPLVPPGQWKESGRHVKEGYTWWLTQGEDMLRRYLEQRTLEIEQNAREIVTVPDSRDPMVEHEGVLDVDGVPVKVVIDQAWRSGMFGHLSIVIEDVKSGGSAPDGTFQLGLYAWYLRKTLGWEGQILGRYWDARKGTYGEPVDLIETHPWEEVQLRVLPEAAKKKALLFSPNPSFGGCKSCMVSHACPAAKAAS
jgi:hypothetical protein